MSRHGGEALSDVLDLRRDEERRRAARALLREPLLNPTRSGPELFALVRRHAQWLREWFAKEAGWTLVVESSLARLYKTPADLRDGTRPAVPAVGPKSPFTRRRYVLTCLALAALERADAQVTLGRLVERIVALAADPALEAAGVVFRLDGREERSDVAAVARFLIGLGVLTRVAGDEQAFVSQSGDALYDVDRRVLSVLLAARRAPSTVPVDGAAGDAWALTARRLAVLVEEVRPDTDDLRNRATRHALARRLLDDPVVYLDDLDDDELGYLRSQRGQLLRRLVDGTGLVAEVRAEGIALVDPSGEATDLGMPEEGTDGHATLLLAEELADPERLAAAAPVPVAVLEQRLRDLATAHRAHWRKDATQPGAERELTRLAIDRLVALRLVERRGDGVVPRPALARFSYARATVPAGTR